MLFVGHPQNEPLTNKQVASLMRGVRPSEIDALVRELNRDYRARGCPYWIVAEGAGYRLALRDELRGSATSSMARRGRPGCRRRQSKC